VKGLHGDHLGIHGSILKETSDHARSRGDTTFVHEGRESNGEAHRLARFASSSPAGRYVWFVEPPLGLNIHVILDDF
jgi:hypothetical protein